MKKLFALLAASAWMLLLASSALAGAPLNGDYQSTDLGGPIDVGRYTEGWDVGSGAMLAGTTFNAGSWDGANFGAMWRYTCGTLLNDATLLVDNVDVNGNGNRTYMKTFVGGTIWLSGTGPWGNGDAEYSGPIGSYVEFETVQYSAWERTGVVTNVQATASFDGYDGMCVAFSVANGTEVGSTDSPSRGGGITHTWNECSWWPAPSGESAITDGIRLQFPTLPAEHEHVARVRYGCPDRELHRSGS
jgi:hypothetical protein